jgi:hypothetical protein
MQAPQYSYTLQEISIAEYLRLGLPSKLFEQHCFKMDSFQQATSGHPTLLSCCSTLLVYSWRDTTSLPATNKCTRHPQQV